MRYLTPRQKQVLDFLESFSERNGYMPTCQEISDEIGIKGRHGSYRYLEILKSRGYIKRLPGQQRAIEII